MWTFSYAAIDFIYNVCTLISYAIYADIYQVETNYGKDFDEIEVDVKSN